MDVPYDLNSYVRVLKMATTPTTGDFLQVAKIAALGVLLVGSIGFLIFVVMNFLPGGHGAGAVI